MLLTDILGIALAFITLILLVSVVVTALVQTVQALLRLRARNLMKGLAGLILNARFPKSAPTADDIKDAKRDAMELLNTRTLAVSNRIRTVATRADGINKLWGPGSGVRYWLVGPRVSWIQKEDLGEALEEAGTDLSARSAGAKPAGKNQPPGSIEDFRKQFDRLELQTAKRFQMMSRAWSFALALLVAFVLQMSTPVLLKRLTTDVDYRQRILADADTQAAYAGEAIGRVDYERVAATALEELATEFPAARERIEQASGVGVNKAFIVDELRLTLEGMPQRDEIVARYDTMLDEAAKERLPEAGNALGRLSAYDIGIWPQGSSFYFSREPVSYSNTPDVEPRAERETGLSSPRHVNWRNIFGVLMTAILLSLGAPFWYEMLKNILGLRDALKGKKKDE